MLLLQGEKKYAVWTNVLNDGIFIDKNKISRCPGSRTFFMSLEITS